MLSDRFDRAIEEFNLLRKGDSVVVAVSGGVDSMVLLHLLYASLQKRELSLIVAHVDHGLRPRESEKEKELVEKEADRLGLPFEFEKLEVVDFSHSRGLSLQDGARRVRFNFLMKVMARHGAQKVALGHNADDQVETMLFRLIRGAGLKGLKGMLPIRDGFLIRPLLDIWRSEIEAYALGHEIPFRVDSSNLKRDYLRNRIRLSLIPFLESEFQPAIKRVLHRASKILGEEDEYLERAAEEAFRTVVLSQESAVSFSFTAFQSLHPAIRIRVLERILRTMAREGDYFGKDWVPLGRVLQMFDRRGMSFSFDLPSGIRFERRYDQFVVRRGTEESPGGFEAELTFPGRTFIPQIRREVVLTTEPAGQAPLNAGPECAFLDYRSVIFPLRIRNLRPGDRFRPMGSKGTQKLKQFFIDHKVPRIDRPKVPLLISGEMISWVVGYRIDERVKVTGRTETVLKIELIPRESDGE